jgi:hypothetical protein
VGPRLPKDKDDKHSHGGNKDAKHKGSEHKDDGHDESHSSPNKPIKAAGDNRGRGKHPVRKSYAQRYREARIGE